MDEKDFLPRDVGFLEKVQAGSGPRGAEGLKAIARVLRFNEAYILGHYEFDNK